MWRRGARSFGVGVGGTVIGALALIFLLVIVPASAFASTTVPEAYCSAQRAAAAGSVLINSVEARASAQQFLLDVRTPGPFSDWVAGKVDAGTEADDLDGHPAVFVFRITNKNGAYLGYLTVDAVRHVSPVVEFSRNQTPVFTTMSDAEASLAASGRDGLAKRQVYLGPLQYSLETLSATSATAQYVRIAELERSDSADPARGPPPTATGSAVGALGSRFHVITGVPDYAQFEYNYRSSEYNAATVPAATGIYQVKPYLGAGAYWSGCGPTSAGNVIKYWAGHGYPLLDRGSLPMYPAYYDPNAANAYAPAKSTAQKMINDLHVFFHTFSSPGLGGAADMADFAPAMLDYADQIGGYDFTAAPIHWFTWLDYSAEIAADRPVLLGFNGLKVYKPAEFDYEDHAVTGVGYDYTPGSTASEYMIIHDNWPGNPSDVYVQFDGGNADYTWRFMVAVAPAVAPANNAFASATVVSGSSGSVIGVSRSATKQTGEPAHAGKAGGASVWFSWTPSTSGWYGFSTAGTSFDTLLGVYTGTSVGILTPISSNDDISKSVLQSRAGFYAASGVTYHIAIDGYAGATGAYQLSWFPLHSLSGTMRTAGGAPVSGADVTCSDGRTMTTSGSGSFTFPGLFDGAYTVTPAVRSGAGCTPSACSATVSGSNGSGLDFVAQPNDAFDSAVPLTGRSGTATGSSVSATKESGEPVYGGGATVWFSWTAPASGRTWLSAVGSSFDTLLAVHSGPSLGQLSVVAYNDDYHYPDTKTSALSFNAVAGTTYRICLDGFKPQTGSTATGSYRLAWAPVSKAVLTQPTLSVTSPTHGKSFTITGYASPWFKGSVCVYLYRKVSGTYKVYPSAGKYASRTVTTSGTRAKYTYKVSVPYKGSWAVRAYYAGGTFATSAWSAYKYFTVK